MSAVHGAAKVIWDDDRRWLWPRKRYFRTTRLDRIVRAGGFGRLPERPGPRGVPLAGPQSSRRAAFIISVQSLDAQSACRPMRKLIRCFLERQIEEWLCELVKRAGELLKSGVATCGPRPVRVRLRARHFIVDTFKFEYEESDYVLHFVGANGAVLEEHIPSRTGAILKNVTNRMQNLFSLSTDTKQEEVEERVAPDGTRVHPNDIDMRVVELLLQRKYRIEEKDDGYQVQVDSGDGAKRTAPNCAPRASTERRHARSRNHAFSCRYAARSIRRQTRPFRCEIAYPANLIGCRRASRI